MLVLLPGSSTGGEGSCCATCCGRPSRRRPEGGSGARPDKATATASAGTACKRVPRHRSVTPSRSGYYAGVWPCTCLRGLMLRLPPPPPKRGGDRSLPPKGGPGGPRNRPPPPPLGGDLERGRGECSRGGSIGRVLVGSPLFTHQRRPGEKRLPAGGGGGSRPGLAGGRCCWYSTTTTLPSIWPPSM